MLPLERQRRLTMAQGYICINCGWQETIHICGGAALSESDREEMSVRKDGFPLTQMECLGSYEPSEDELAHAHALEEQCGSHEGQH
jgi:hypothetical protein